MQNFSVMLRGAGEISEWRQVQRGRKSVGEHGGIWNWLMDNSICTVEKVCPSKNVILVKMEKVTPSIGFNFIDPGDSIHVSGSSWKVCLLFQILGF